MRFLTLLLFLTLVTLVLGVPTPGGHKKKVNIKTTVDSTNTLVPTTEPHPADPKMALIPDDHPAAVEGESTVQMCVKIFKEGVGWVWPKVCGGLVNLAVNTAVTSVAASMGLGGMETQILATSIAAVAGAAATMGADKVNEKLGVTTPAKKPDDKATTDK